MKFAYYDEGIEVAIGRLTPVWIHSGILFLLAFITFPLWSSFRTPGMTTSCIVMIGMLLSLLAHEAGHAWIASRLGHHPTLIRLHAGGGEAVWETGRYTRRDDCLITLAGPMANLMIGLCCLLLYYAFLPDPLASFSPSPDRPWSRPPPSSPSVFFRAVHWLAALNLIWAGINLLPAFPLDGGNLSRQFIEARFGPHRALFWTGLLGMILAIVSKLIFLIGIFAGMVIWAPPEFMPNYLAVKASRQNRPKAVQ
ncbi:M50 family metallopeptidase [Rhizobium binxianense]